jgi:hypothetical protein
MPQLESSMSSKRFGFLLNTVYVLATLISATSIADEKSGKVLWDEWYGVTVGTKTHYEYYNEKFELKDDKIFYQSDTWKKEEDYINRESLGDVSMTDDAVTPVFFNFHGTYRSTEVQIDGSLSPSHMLTVKVKKGDQDGPLIKKSISSKVFLSSFFPIWLGKHVKDLQKGKELNFLTLLEDGSDPDFQSISGSAKLMEPDDFSTQNKAVKVKVTLGENHSIWWIDSRGASIKIEMPDTKTTVEKITKARALHFLD